MRILLVDDDEILIDVLQRTLGEKKYIFDTVLDGEQGWTYGCTYSYDLIILDWSLPKLDGISLCKRFRAYGYDTPILLLTARHSSQEKIMGLDAGADDYLCKPFNVEELEARIRALLRRSKSNALPVLTWGDLQLDTRSCQVTYQGDLLLLTSKEYQLLELFMSHSQEIFNIEEIIENLWSSVEYPSKATVRSHLRHLRKTLKQAGLEDNPIETLRGRGYCLKSLPQSDNLGENLFCVLKEYEQPSPEMFNKQQRHLKALNQAWEKYRHKSNQQLKILQEALQALQKGHLSSEQREEAQFMAHKLAGTVGIFGFDEGSRLASELEQLLQENLQDERKQVLRFEIIFNALQKQLTTEDDSLNRVSKQLKQHSPLLLIIDHDRQFTTLLTQEAIANRMQTKFIPSPELAKTWLMGLQNHQRPQVVLLRLSFNELSINEEFLQEYLSLISELNSFIPSIPVIIIADRDRFDDRLLLAQHGVTFYLKQPVSAKQAIVFCQQALDRSSQDKKVMIVDDDVELLKLLPSLLQPWGFKFTTLDDPRQFWDLLQAIAPDLLILDIEMPYLSGIELCRVLRTDPHWCRLPILYLSIHEGAVIQDQVFASGADELVHKPVEIKQLAHRILYHLERNKITLV